jgi:hypothetical protein
LHAMLLASKIVGDIPMVGTGLARNVLATLDVAGLRLLHAASAATDLGTHRASRDSATDCGDSVARSATDLVTENATDHGTDERSGNVQVAGPTLGKRYLLAFDPASLLGRSDHGSH